MPRSHIDVQITADQYCKPGCDFADMFCFQAISEPDQGMKSTAGGGKRYPAQHLCKHGIRAGAPDPFFIESAQSSECIGVAEGKRPGFAVDGSDGRPGSQREAAFPLIEKFLQARGLRTHGGQRAKRHRTVIGHAAVVCCKAGVVVE